ncbi:helix-turn-helix transcriptional regulator [Fibrobacter sp. UWH4]|uniref:helix-turn-helix transcriptional regulator n=1 Tax=Fibrobacter sp. UWH4 TaxID=1896210 RepID=UPI00091D0825|nr:helix-turn-helix transcriptional regulator [Fibrobacter sp. UWH4]SHL05324.1 Helix-turn-helix [Fibrobacter sp. UWH4]
MENEESFFDCNKFLIRKGWDRKELAKELGFEVTTIGNWCAKKSTPNYSTLVKLINLGMTLEEMFGETVKEKLSPSPQKDNLPNPVNHDFKEAVRLALTDLLRV